MSLVESKIADGTAWLWLNRPERHNALVPELVNELRLAIISAADHKPRALVLSARGRSFSTGGDIAGFLDHAQSPDTLKDYADNLVGGLHEALLDLLCFPAPVIAAVNGPVTGGSAGFLLTADLVAMDHSAFLQPYYSTVGFGPDGGWTALLPDRIGTAKALQVQYANRRLQASDLLDLGLVSAICAPEALERQVRAWVDQIALGFASTHLATRQGVWDEERRALVRRRLDREKERFLELVTAAETVEGMKNFKKKCA